MKCLLTVFAVFNSFVFSSEILDEREWLTKKYLPKLAGRVLFVGVEDYNKDYYTLVQDPFLYETIDFLPKHARFGSPYKHYTGEFLSFDPGYLYDHICVFGIMGQSPFAAYHNIIEDSLVNALIRHSHNLLKKGGTLQLGPGKIWMPEFNTEYWLEKFEEPPLDTYKVIINSWGPRNMIYWAEKTVDN